MVEKDYGFVLKRRNFRETSLIASLYTLRFGKIAGIFKGFHTLKREFSSTLDTFTLNEFIFYPKKREIWLVSYADLIYDYSFLRRDLSRAKVAFCIFSIVDKVMPLWDKNLNVFYLIKGTLKYLEHGEHKKALYVFLIKFLTLSGLKPELNRCLLCDNKLNEEVFFSTSKGGLVCQGCFRPGFDGEKISRETASSLLYIQNANFSLSWRINPTGVCKDEIIYILKIFCSFHLGVDIFI